MPSAVDRNLLESARALRRLEQYVRRDVEYFGGAQRIPHPDNLPPVTSPPEGDAEVVALRSGWKLVNGCLVKGE